jgi:CheY-like chemotaxis protein
MTPFSPGDATLLTGDLDRRRLALALYPLRRTAYRMIADCERILDSLQSEDRRRWAELVGHALLGARSLLTVLAGSDLADPSQVTQRISTVGARLQEPRRRIIDALTPLTQLVPVTPEEELILQDARTLLDSAVSLNRFGDGIERTAALPSDRDRASGHGSVTAGARVLAVDDDALIRTLLSRHVSRLGHTVIQAENGRVALERVRQEAPDLVLTDINMPVMDGLALLKELKRSEDTRHIPVIVLSAQDDVESVAECIRNGAEDHLAKPFEPAVLNARVSSSLDRKRMQDLERDYRRRVSMITAAAEAVERESYLSEMLAPISSQPDQLGRLARVFDRMVSGLASRQERLQQRVSKLRTEMQEVVGARARTADAPADDDRLRTGQTFAGRYEILGSLGQGGMGSVYRARDMELGEEIALKIVRPDIIKSDPQIIERLKSEIRLARRISHRNVVRAHDLGESDGTYFISMEYVKGITVADLLDRRGRLGVESALAIGVQLAEALATAHAQDIVHRDIKPANLLVDEEGALKVTDFGIAVLSKRDKKLTLGGFIVGTPEYMAPEQLIGGAIDARTDLFAMGVVLYECLAGRPPFAADSPTALMAQMSGRTLVPLSDRVPRVPAALDTLVCQLLEFRASDRPSSAALVAEQLAQMDYAARRDSQSLAINLDLIEPALPT